ncbi:MAG: hypothetical protein FJ096_10360 [Deltaproteobacteria bacterium]|nr:hypothetical protein [Deltaproteobacteria bacterium]
MTSRRMLLTGSLALALLAGCTVEELPGVTATFVVPDSLDALADERFLDHPFPSDLRRHPDGTVRFAGFYNPRMNALLDQYTEVADGGADGFSPLAAGYLRFDAPLDPASLPATPKDGLAPEASVQLIDVDETSPRYGKRELVTLSFRAAEGQYVLPNTLRFMPTLGFPLRPHTRYALVVTDRARSLAGGPARPSAELFEVLGLLPASGPRAALGAAWAPTLDVLAKVGLARESIANLAVFTTTDPTEELLAFRDALRATVPPPRFNFRVPWRRTEGTGYVEYVASYGPSPNFQEGKLPFAKYGDGGAFHYAEGKPAALGEFEPRFSLTVPTCPMPEAGYPIVLHAHGTGGDFRSHLAFARDLAEKCIASMGVDQIFHGKRPGAPADGDTVQTQILFFNFENSVAARTNGRQSALDEVQRARLFTESRVTVPASIALDGKEVRFDPKRVMFFGHSQGGLNGPLFLAADDGSIGGVMSGSGGTLGVSLLGKTKPTPSVASLVRVVFLGLGPEDDELDSFHPAISLAQSVVDPVDPSNYARLTIREPRPGHAARSIYMTEGVGPDGAGDAYSPPKSIEAHALALGLPLAEPSVYPVPEYGFGGPGMVAIPSSGLNGNLANGAATGALVQWVPLADSDGHFVLYDLPAARAQAVGFLRSLADGGPGTVPSVGP